MKTVSILKMKPKLSILGVYTISELDTMIFSDGYIPIASGAELNNIRTSATYNMGVGTRWEDSYDVAINTSGKNKFVMVSPISLAAYQIGAGWAPIPQITNAAFVFDGNELNISDMLITSQSDGSNIGLFSLIYPATLKNIRLTGEINTGTYVVDNVGGLLGRQNSGTIDNCQANVTITGNYSTKVGGLIGFISGGTITNTSTSGSIFGGKYVGGLVGDQSGGYIQYCNSSANVDSSNIEIYGEIGGLIGGYRNTARVEESYALGNVGSSTSGNSKGGLIGSMIGAISYKVKNCYSKGSVIGAGYIGGLVGNVFYDLGIENCYSVGSVTGTDANVGGLLGRLGYATVTNSYWDTQTSGQATSAGGTGKTTTEMKEGAIGTDFVDWYTDIWTAVNNENYPQLIDNREEA